MNRRGFLAGIFAAGVAPAFVKVGSLMRLDTSLVLPSLKHAELDVAIDMSVNRFLTPQMIIEEATGILARHIDDKLFRLHLSEAQSRAIGGKRGDTLLIRKPVSIKAAKS